MQRENENNNFLSEQLPFYNMRSVQQLLNLLVYHTKEVKPIFDIQYKCRYPDVEHATGLNPFELQSILDRLAVNNILDPHFFEKIPVCEKCSSANLALKYLCSHCESSSITNYKVIEHRSCGYIDIENKFYHKNSRGDLICPRCSQDLRAEGIDYKINKGWFFCNDCSKRSREPFHIFHCRECKSKTFIDDVQFINLYSYTLNESLDISPLILIEPIRKTLENLGLQSESSGTVIGKSGVKHKFDIVCNNSDLVSVIDVVYSNIIVDESHVIKLFASAFDIEANKSIIIAIPAATDTAEKLAQKYDITLIQGKDTNELLEKLKKEILSTSHRTSKKVPLPGSL